MTPTTTDYQVINRRGVIIMTFSHEDLARRFARKSGHLHDGLRIVRVDGSKVAHRVYTPRPSRRRVDFSIPQFGAVSPVGAQ